MTDSGKFWGPIPVYILQDHQHKAGHLRVLGAILSCPQPYFPSLREIGERSGHTPKYCSKMITQMVRFGTLEREQRYSATNVYRLTGYEDTTEVHTECTTEVPLKESLKENKYKGNGTLSGFDLFCSLYPRHRLGYKNALQNYWLSNGLEKSSEVIVHSVKEYRESPDWQEREGKFVPGAMRFLEEERWAVYSDDTLTQYEED